MKYIKPFGTNESLREDGGYYYIDGLSDESHILFPVIDKLNSGLQEGIDTLFDKIYESSSYIDDLFRNNRNISQNKEIALIQGFILNIRYQHEDGDLTDEEVENYIHDLVVECRIPAPPKNRIDIGGYHFDPFAGLDPNDPENY